MTEIEVQSSKERLKDMLAIIQEIKDYSNAIFTLITQNVKRYETMSKFIAENLKSSGFEGIPVPVYGCVLLYGVLEKMVSTVKYMSQVIVHDLSKDMEKSQEEYASASAEFDQKKKKISALLQKFQTKLVDCQKSYKRTSKNYTKAKKATQEANSVKERDSKDPLLMYVLSVQEKDNERHSIAAKQEQNLEKQLVEKKNVLKLQIEECNKEMEECEKSFTEIISLFLKTMQKMVVDCFSNISEEVANYLNQQFDRVTSLCVDSKAVINFKALVIEKNPNLSKIDDNNSRC